MSKSKNDILVLTFLLTISVSVSDVRISAEETIEKIARVSKASTYKYISLYRSKGSNGTVVNRAYHSLNGGSCEH